jgi:hypothetical protein
LKWRREVLVEVPKSLSDEMYLEYLAAQRAVKAALDRYRMSDAIAFYTILRGAGINLNDRVIIRKGSTEVEGILVGTRKFAKIRKGGKPSKYHWHIDAPYTVEKIKLIQQEEGRGR